MTLAGPTPILQAVYGRDAGALSRLLETGARPTLFEAAAIGDAALIKRAASENPAAVSMPSPDGWPPLHLAAHFDRGDAVDALLVARADVRARAQLVRHGADVNAKDAGGHRPLHLAAFEGDAETLQALLAHGATDAQNAEGRTALQIAEDRGHAAIARRLRGELP